MTTQADVINALIADGALVFKGKYIFTNKYLRAFKAEVAPTKPNTPTGKELLASLLNDAKVPFRIETPTGSYTVKTASQYSKTYIHNMIAKEKCTYKEAVHATELYYKTNAMPKTVTNFFKEGIFEVYLEEAKKRGGTIKTKQENNARGSL